ncbi:MAG: NERD domain-containing protein [Firmicutes bacterium]|nr:NERD domain-containing protein [Bacillota bacterium]
MKKICGGLVIIIVGVLIAAIIFKQTWLWVLLATSAAIFIILSVIDISKNEPQSNDNSIREYPTYQKNDGKAFELFIDNLLRTLSSEEYTVLSDITLEVNSQQAQIDHIIVSIYGVFVIETKDWAGLISGTWKDRTFVQELDFNYNHYDSPIKQNEWHIKVLKEVLGYIFCHSLVVFSANSTLNIDAGKYAWVGHFCSLISAIKEHKAKILSFGEVNKIVRLIQEHCCFKKAI